MKSLRLAQNAIWLRSIFIFLPVCAHAMGNPSSEFCEKNGGKSDSRTPAGGGGYGVCMFKDGTECEEWAFFQGKCKPGQMKKYEDTLSKLPDLGFFIHFSGYVNEKRPATNIDVLGEEAKVNWVEEWHAKYAYYCVAVENGNLHGLASTPTKLKVFGDKTEEFDVPALGSGQKSKYYHLFIPINREGDFATINPERTQKEVSFDNNSIREQYMRKGKQLTKEGLMLFRKNKGKF